MSLNHLPPPSDQSIWRRARKCSFGSCVEVATTPDAVLLRDSKQNGTGPQPIISVERDTWEQLAKVIATERPEMSVNRITIELEAGGRVTVRDQSTRIALRFDHLEWSTFAAGVRNGDFE